MLTLQNVSVFYDKLHVLKGVGLDVPKGEVSVLMGANGAGKSTLLKALFGLVPMTGHISLDGKDVVSSPQAWVKKGIAYVSQDQRVFPNLTVRENLEIGMHLQMNKKEIKTRMDEVKKLFPMITHRMHILAGHLSGGQQQQIALARCLMTRPEMIILDEPSNGLSPNLVKETFEKIAEINQQRGTTFLIVEHNLKSILPLAHQAFILEQGQLIASGKPSSQIITKTLDRIFVSS